MKLPKDTIEDKRVVLEALERENDRAIQRVQRVIHPRRPIMAERHYHLADLCREAGRYDDSQKHEKAGYDAARNQYIGYLSGKVIRRLRDPRTRFAPDYE